MKPNIPALTGIRVIGALSIAVFHFQYTIYEAFPKIEGISWIIGNGFFAVPMFFVLSGIVIELNYGNKKLDYIRFIYNRLSKLLPISIVSQAIAFAVMYIQINYFNNFGVETPDFYNLGNWLKNAFLLWSIKMPYKQYQWNQPAWNASAEFILYLFFPAFIPVRYYINKTNKLWVCILASFGLAYIAQNMMTDTVYYGWLFSAIIYFAIGIILCRAIIIYKENRKEIYTKIMSAVQIVCPAMLLVCLFWGEGYSFVTVIITLFIFSLIEEEGVVSKVLSLAPFQKWGRVSYTFYMMHWCVFAFSNLIKIQNPNFVNTQIKYQMYVVITWIVLVGVSYFLYVCVEEPCSKAMKKLYKKE